MMNVIAGADGPVRGEVGHSQSGYAASWKIGMSAFDKIYREAENDNKL